ncbi:MAG: MaoC family dehydratase N-terminal domain-containing protein [Peptococcaceae bacterium]|nr:MaoC family dehydratase N-terminal domain-containing protein [Peptococcaceae bacterium]
MIGKHLIGRESKPVKVKIEDYAVRRFAEAVGVPFSNQVPPTFVGTFIEGNIDGVDLLQYETIHGEQKITYYQPVSIGDYITYTRRITDVYERTGRLGRMIFIVIETKGCNPAGEPVFSCSSTLIILGGRAEGETPLGLSG